MGISEIIVILVVAILVLGPEKLPSTIIQATRFFKAIKKNIDEAKASIEKEIKINELKEEAQKYKDEFSQSNENIRKKLSFEEFDELKQEILEKTSINDKTKEENLTKQKEEKNV